MGSKGILRKLSVCDHESRRLLSWRKSSYRGIGRVARAECSVLRMAVTRPSASQHDTAACRE